MFHIFLLIMIIVPAIEIMGIFFVGHLIGGWWTFILILLTGFVGAFLAKQEAKKVWNYARHQLSIGQVPTSSILDGICIFAGGLMLLTPGFFTDIFGFLLIYPRTRMIFRVWLLYIIQKVIIKRRFIR